MIFLVRWRYSVRNPVPMHGLLLLGSIWYVCILVGHMYICIHIYIYIILELGESNPIINVRSSSSTFNINIYNSKKLLGKSSGWVGKRWVHSHEEDDFEGGN